MYKERAERAGVDIKAACEGEREAAGKCDGQAQEEEDGCGHSLDLPVLCCFHSERP